MICLMAARCVDVNLVGKVTSNLITNFPFFPGSFLIGHPSFSSTTSYPGHTTSSTRTGRFRPSRVFRFIAVPARASTRGISCFTIRSFPSRLYTSWGFISKINVRSCGNWPCGLSPLSGNVIRVPFFQPGSTSTARTSVSTSTFLHKTRIDRRLRKQHSFCFYLIVVTVKWLNMSS
jgi:hypothetical protein